jgi:sigma-B regulation protein RsbU (phosphoserine phosphatase)
MERTPPMALTTYVHVLAWLGPDAGQAIQLDRETTSIGRSAENDIVLSQAYVSRQHAKVVREGPAYFVVDLGSTHGTFVNGQRIDGRAPLGPGSTVQFGSLAAPGLRFELQSAEPRNSEDTPRLHDILSSISGLGPAADESKKPAAREMEQLSFLLNAARALNSSEAVEDILRALLELTLQLTGVERGFVFLSEGGEMRLAQGLSNSGSPLYEDSTVSRSAIKSAIESDAKFSISDTLTDENAQAWSSIVVNNIRSIYCIPLRKRAASGQAQNLLGLLYLDSQIGGNSLCAIDHELLDTIAAEAAALLHNVLLAQDEKKARQAREELAVAARIHSGLMSLKLPTLPYVELHAKTVPCLAIGGDFFDAVALDDHVALTVADVSGKGVSAAIVAATIQGIVHSQLMAGQSLTSIAHLLNQFLCERNVSKYATMVILKVFRDGRVEYLNCGHVPPVALIGGEVKRLAECNLIVGLVASATYESAELRLQPGERILLATDGVTEAENEQGECLGMEGLENLARLASVDEMLAVVSKFQANCEAQDDCTLLDVRYAG